MNSFDKKNSSEFDKCLNTAETDVLIREEAEFLAKSFLDKEKYSFDFSNVNELDTKLNEIYSEQKKDSNGLTNSSYIKKIENKIDQSTNDIKSVLESFSGYMQKIVDNFEKVLNCKKNENSDAIKTKDGWVDDVDFVKPVDWEDSEMVDLESQQEIAEEKVKELLDEFNNSLDLKLLETNQKVNDLSNNIDEISKNLNNYVEVSESEKANLFATISEENAKAFHDIDFVKNQYVDLEKEISKLFSDWAENNRLLINLENLLTDMAEQKEMFSQELHEFLDETHQKVVDGQKNLNDITNELMELRDKIMSSDERIFNLEKNSEKLLTFDERVIELSKEVVLEELAKRNLLDPVQLLSNNENVEALLASTIFQQSLESKITRMIIDNNNYIGDEFAAKFDKVSSETSAVSRSLENLETDFNNYKDSIDFSNFSSEIRSKIDLIDNRTDLFYSELTSKYNDTNQKFKVYDEKLDNFTANQEQIIKDVIESSQPLSDLISRKIIEVVDLKLEKINEDFKVIADNLEEKIISFTERYNQKLLEEELDRRNSELESKIKNETLNAIWLELTKRDEKINLHSEEIVKNYEVLIENNKILESLEKLVLQQCDEINGFKQDREETIELLMSKIVTQKEQIDQIKNKIADILKAAGINLVEGANDNNTYVLESIKQVTSELVLEEIKKLNLIDETKLNNLKTNQDSESDFFVKRMKDILDRLDNSTYENIKVDDSLGINLNDLKQENPTVKDDDFGWFYEKEYENYISSKKDDKKDLLDEFNSSKSNF